MKIRINLMLVGIILSVSVYGQVKEQIVEIKCGTSIITSHNTGNSKYTQAFNQNKSEEVFNDSTKPLIIQFKGLPISKIDSNSGSQKSAQKNHQTVFENFKNDFQTIAQETSTLKSGSIEPTIKDFYQMAYFGTTVVASEDMAEQIANLSYVKKVTWAVQIKTSDDNSISMLGADGIWSNLGYKGEGIVIGIIDTGIDYFNPDLGGGIGEGFKVLGGYDFVNEDNDPMDDHFHGTHVAGIAAGNGNSVKGIAPEASLYAYKVLNKEGIGWSFDIIAAIERCVDPNQDGNYSDKLDVVNLSLGSVGSYKDPTCEAVDNASELGVIFCIAAGNSGLDGYSSISSPAAALTAITVGASDFSDSLAWFSSIGPNADTFNIKPEVLAPGVNIYSTVANNEYGSLSGTSMATPQVAGICALLKQAHPDWNYSKMKSALMTTAKDLGYSPFKQGAGRVQPIKAIEANVFTNPSEINFNVLSDESSLATNKSSVMVYNQSTELKNYEVLFENLPTHFSITANPQTFDIAPNDSVQLNFDLSYNIEESNDDELFFGSTCFLVSDNDSLRLPWALAITKKYTIQTDGVFPMVSFTSENSQHTVFLTDTLQTVNLPNERYIVFGDIDKYFLIYDTDKHGDTLEFKTDLCKNTFELEMRDLDNNIISSLTTVFQFTNYYSKRHTIGFYNAFHYAPKFYCNDFDSTNHIHYSAYAEIGDDVYIAEKYATGMSNSTILTVGPNDYNSIDLNIHHSKSQNLRINMPSPKFNEGSYDAVSHGLENMKINSRNLKFHYTPLAYDTIPIHPWIDMGWMESIHRTNDIRNENDTIVSYGQYNKYLWYDNPIGKNIYKLASVDKKYGNNQYNLNNGPVKIMIDSRLQESNTLTSYSRIFGHNDEAVLHTDIKMNLMNDKGDEITSGTESFSTSITPGIYETKMTYSDPEDVIGMSVILESTQDLSKDDIIPPTIMAFQIRNSGDIPTYFLENNEEASIIFSVADYTIDSVYIENDWYGEYEYIHNYKPILKDSVKLFIKPASDDNWIALAHSYVGEDSVIGYVWQADISNYTSMNEELFDVMIKAVDTDQNTTKETWNNCFKVSDGTDIQANDDKYDIKVNETIVFNPSESFLLNDDGWDGFICDFDYLEGNSNAQIDYDRDGNLEYIPKKDFEGTDSFQYIIDNCNGNADTATVTINIGDVNSVNSVATESSLQCHPNPFADELNIDFQLNGLEQVTLEVYSVMGTKVASIIKNKRLQGSQSVKWNIYDNSTICKSGIYIIILSSDKQRIFQKVVLE